MEAREQAVEAFGAILSAPPGVMSDGCKKERRSVEEPAGGSDVPRALDEWVVLNLPMYVRCMVPICEKLLQAERELGD